MDDLKEPLDIELLEKASELYLRLAPKEKQAQPAQVGYQPGLLRRAIWGLEDVTAAHPKKMLALTLGGGLWGGNELQKFLLRRKLRSAMAEPQPATEAM